LASSLRERVIAPVMATRALGFDSHTRVAINPEGPMVPGGPVSHAGLTGRKCAVDSYGDFARQGAAALSGKDPSRIERTGSYAARHVARNVVGAGLARRCEIQISYAVGLAQPVSVLVNTFGTHTIDEHELTARVVRTFDLRPAAIVRRFRLRSLPGSREGPFFRRLAAYGHVGRSDLDLPWERLDGVAQLRA
jgi:S-adenosylmethionine synthetase